MKKVIKAIILTPMWPLIWLKMGFNLKRNCWYDHCEFCGGGDGCYLS